MFVEWLSDIVFANIQHNQQAEALAQALTKFEILLIYIHYVSVPSYIFTMSVSSLKMSAKKKN